MTCQWCLHYRRKRGGESRCDRPGGDGLVMPIKGAKDGPSPVCLYFDPRKSCTTCSCRCSQDMKEERLDQFGLCPHWSLRKLSSWGGSRRRRRRPPGLSPSEDLKSDGSDYQAKTN